MLAREPCDLYMTGIHIFVTSSF